MYLKFGGNWAASNSVLLGVTVLVPVNLIVFYRNNIGICTWVDQTLTGFDFFLKNVLENIIQVYIIFPHSLLLSKGIFPSEYEVF